MELKRNFKLVCYLLLGIGVLAIILKMFGLLPFLSWWVILFPIWFPIMVIITLILIIFCFLKYHKVIIYQFTQKINKK